MSKPDPPAPRAAQRELRPPIRCGHSGGELPGAALIDWTVTRR